MKLRNMLKLSALAIVPMLGAAQGCVSDDDNIATAPPENVTEVNHKFRGKWAVDMKKVDEHYGRSSTYFLGMTAEEAGLPNPQLPPVWDQTARREADGSLHEETGTEYAVIDRDGNKIDPQGYVNIIPMLQDTEPAKQKHIRDIMNDGDVIVYVHPEQTGVRGAMERRASHVGMHYEYTTEDGRELVHHIDNPNSYGPVYNHRPDRQMPFHVYRFKPLATDRIGGGGAATPVESPEGIDYSAAQRDAVLAIVNGGDVSTQDARKAFHKKLDIELGMRADAAGKIVQYRTNNGTIDSLDVLAAIPRVGPAALRTLRDASGAEAGGSAGSVMTAAQAAAYGTNARNWAMMTNDISPFADFFDLRLQTLDDLPAFAQAAVNGQQINNLYCSGLAYANLNLAINFPLNEQGLGDLYSTFASGSWRFSDANGEITAQQLADSAGLTSLNRLVFEPYQPSDILNAWIETYWWAIPPEAKQQIFASPEFQQQIVQGFRKLEWSDSHSEEKQSSGEFEPATVENVERWAAAYGQPAEATEGYLASHPEIAAKFAELGLNSEGMTPMDVFQAVEDAVVVNEFVPPQIWMDHADRDNASLVYVGTVLNCEILTAVDGSGDDACAGSGGGVTEFSEAAADSSHYPDYVLNNGGHVAHRRFDVVGPESWGPDSTVSVRITHGDVGDVRFILHLPAHWQNHPAADLPYQEFRGWCSEQREMGGSCAAEVGILLEPNESGPVTDKTYTWRLGDICDFSADGAIASCPLASPWAGENGDEFGDRGVGDISTWADGGRVSVTAIDLGNTSAGDLENCPACPTSGGHYNQYKVHLIQALPQ